MRALLIAAIVTLFFSCQPSEKKEEMTVPADNFSLDFSRFYWIHPPSKFNLKEKELEIITDPQTDYWQRTYYGFQNDNAPTFVKKIVGDFSFSVRTDFDSKKTV